MSHATPIPRAIVSGIIMACRLSLHAFRTALPNLHVCRSCRSCAKAECSLASDKFPALGIAATLFRSWQPDASIILPCTYGLLKLASVQGLAQIHSIGLSEFMRIFLNSKRRMQLALLHSSCNSSDRQKARAIKEGMVLFLNSTAPFTQHDSDRAKP